ncbi:HlyD family secretion protein [Chitinophaga costaii]|uniref:HlyD family secretion protein n=1 Tax=Chitinophaga costaii TaxID=1335309 RepID=A0A1C4G718_9BACT|nr:HlyD family efflux transporter periplasmic adaptor subunit [Chitinophaga costaii]PUZ20095.1 RND transporter [Chitinophaga costaii]SCC63625.1 HlyD family secretion protein [Chitinophaga costaii]
MKHTFLYFGLLMVLPACHDAVAIKEPEEVHTPVTVTNIRHEPMITYLELNATAAFLQQSVVKANTSGYLQTLHLRQGEAVKAGQLLFSIKTREASSIGNAVNLLDSTFKFSGVNPVRAGSSGYVSQLSHQSGDYVQEGEQVVVISNQQSFAFLLDVPFELRNVVPLHKAVTIILPDSTQLPGFVDAIMPSVDPAAQTQRLVLKVPGTAPLPENLVAKVRIEKTNHPHAATLPKEALLTNETQSDYWVMKLTNESTAVKVPVNKGLELNGRVEILSPAFSDSDRILISGNYALGDTAKVSVNLP